MKLPAITQAPEPKGKRRVHHNIWGNTVGYIAGRRWKEFGCTEHSWVREEAEEWLKQEERK